MKRPRRILIDRNWRKYDTQVQEMKRAINEAKAELGMEHPEWFND